MTIMSVAIIHLFTENEIIDSFPFSRCNTAFFGQIQDASLRKVTKELHNKRHNKTGSLVKHCVIRNISALYALKVPQLNTRLELFWGVYTVLWTKIRVKLNFYIVNNYVINVWKYYYVNAVLHWIWRILKKKGANACNKLFSNIIFFRTHV